MRSLQKFVSAHSSVHNHFNLDRNLSNRQTFRTNRTAALADPFNPAQAILAAAAYLKEIEGRFGNLGLAAAAYNAGEAGLERYLAEAGALPAETRAYVHAITGHAVEAWRDGPPPAPDLVLDRELLFQGACLARARGISAFRSPPVPASSEVRLTALLGVFGPWVR